MENTLASGGGMLPDGFPVGMRVLAVDGDIISLTTLKQMLQRCGYRATTTTSAEEALRELRENPEGFDLVMTGLHLRRRMDGLGLLNRAKDRLPVVMFSGYDEAVATVRRGIDEGACIYLQKPLRIEEIRNIWQHVVRRIRLNASAAAASPGANALRLHDGDDAKTTRKRGGDDSDEGSDTAQGSTKKPKFMWSAPLLHASLFVKAVNQLKGKEEITPKRIKELMEYEGEHVTEDQVASHLQKYRRDCINAELSQANRFKNYMTPQDIQESLAIYMKSQRNKIGRGSIIRQTSLQLRDGASSVGCGVLGNGSFTASHGGVLTNEESLVSAVAGAIEGTTTGYGGHGVLTNESLVTASLPSNLAQQQQPMSSGFLPTNFISINDPNPVTHEGSFAQQTSQLGYVDDGAMLPWSELDGLGDDPLMSSLLGGDEVMQDARTLEMSQAMHDCGTTGEIRSLQPQGFRSGFSNWESTDGTAGTSGGGGVLTDGMMADQFDDELERFVNPNMQ